MHKVVVIKGLTNKRKMAQKAVHMPELWASKGLINLDPSYVGSILVKGKVQLSIPHNSGIRGAWKAII